AEAIAEAATRPTMRFVALKTEAQLDVQILHRVRDRLVGQRTALMNQVRSILLEARRKLRELFAVLHRKLLVIVRDDTVCRRLMTVPGVGPVVSMAFTATIDVPARFKSSKAVGAALGLTPILNQSGDSKRLGRV